MGAAVQRAGDGGLPRYMPGHADRVAALRAMLPPGVAVAAGRRLSAGDVGA